jgi:hypothetical protein
MEEQIQKTMKKAFYDLIDANCSANPDYEWLIRLYIELKGMILKYLKTDGKVYKTIDESFDVELFSQMIRADVFNMDSMVKLVSNTFYWIKEVGAPERDESIDQAKEKVLTSSPEKMISTFLREVHQCLDVYHADMNNYIRSVSRSDGSSSGSLNKSV